MLNTIETTAVAVDRSILTWVQLAAERCPDDVCSDERTPEAGEAAIGHDLISNKHFEGDGAFDIGVELGIRLAVAVLAKPLDPMADVEEAPTKATDRVVKFTRDCRGGS
jgi:hypothetical protein